MIIRSLSVCFNFDDFLDLSLSFNKPWLNDHVVITFADDKKVMEVCNKHKIKFLTTEGSNYNFNKGKMINIGLKYLYSKSDKNDWILIIDSDILVPKLLMKDIQTLSLDTSTIYGIRRRFISQKPKNWEDFLKAINESDEKYMTTIAGNVEIEKVYVQNDFGILGFFQLFNNQCFYPENFSGAAESDMEFNKLFSKRIFLQATFQNISQSFEIYHLGLTGTNWKGRRDERWI